MCVSGHLRHAVSQILHFAEHDGHTFQGCRPGDVSAELCFLNRDLQ